MEINKLTLKNNQFFFNGSWFRFKIHFANG